MSSGNGFWAVKCEDGTKKERAGQLEVIGGERVYQRRGSQGYGRYVLYIYI